MRRHESDTGKTLDAALMQSGATLGDIPGGIAIYELGKSVRLLRVNDELLDVIGYTREEYEALTSQDVAGLVHPGDREALHQFIEQVKKGRGIVKLTCRVFDKSGQYKWVRIAGKLMNVKYENPVACVMFSDVDREMRTERELRDSTIAYRLATENTDINMWQYDVLSRALHLTENAMRVHGERESVIEDFPESVISRGRVRPDCVSAFRDMFMELGRGSERTDGDFWFRNGDEDDWWCERITCINVFDEDGKPVRAIGVGKNITSERMAQERYEDIIKKYQEEIEGGSTHDGKLLAKVRVNLTKNVVESVAAKEGAGICAVGMLYDAAAEAISALGCEQRERDMISRELAREHLLYVYQSGEVANRIEYRRRISGGSVIWVSTTIRMSKNPETRDIMLFLHTYDIHEDRIKDEIITTISGLKHDFMMYIDLRRDYYKLYLGNEDSVVMPAREGGAYVSMMQAVNRAGVVPEDVERAIRDMMPDTMRENLRNRRIFSSVYSAMDSGGEVRQKRIDYAYLDSANDLIILSRSDVTDLFKQQKEQQEILQAALVAAEQANSAKTDFLSRMSHEIRTPMNAIIGMATIAAQSIGDDEQVADCISKIGISSRFLLSLINDILDMSRIESGKSLLKSDKIPFEEFMNGINSICYSQAAAKDIDYENIVDSSVEDYYMGDAMKLQQIVINILSNAVKFTPEHGKVSLSVRQMKKTKNDAVLRFVINDTGCGISEEFIPHLFDAFSQEKAGITAMYGGTGLGLAICKSLVSMMDGVINVRSIVGVGSEFTVDVKLGISEESKTRYRRKPKYNFAELKALVVDDDVMVCEQAIITLKEIGVKAEWVDSGVKAIEQVRRKWASKEYYDLVLVDWKMPDMDGIETARRIRAIVGPDVTIIIITAYDWVSIEHEAKLAGVNLLISKPMFKSSLISAFERAFCDKQNHDAMEIKDDFMFTGKRVLLVEDHPLNVEVAKRLMERKGFTVTHAENGLRALELFTTTPVGYFDAILMDIRMPEMDGLQATYNIRHWRKEDAKTIPIIAMTANAFEDDIQKSKSVGMNAHLAKPIDPKQLFQTLFDFIYAGRLGAENVD